MPLHRDIHWLGRQWAVTGHGLQLINQKQMGYYDIEVARLWEAGVIEAMQAKAWINRADFDEALEIARARFAQTEPAGVPWPTPAVSPQAAPPATNAPVEPSSALTLEELLAQLKAKSAAMAPAAKPVDAPMVEVKREPPDPVPAKPDPRDSVLSKPESAEPEAPTAVRAASELPPAFPRRATLEVRSPNSERPRPALPVFDRKIAGSARFITPWRARLTRWKGILPGLPPRP